MKNLEILILFSCYLVVLANANNCGLKMAKDHGNKCGTQIQAYCNPNDYCSPLGECGDILTHRARGTPNNKYSGIYLKNALKVACEKWAIQQKLEEEKKRKEAEARRKAEAERKRKEEEARKKAEAERNRCKVRLEGQTGGRCGVINQAYCQRGRFCTRWGWCRGWRGVAWGNGNLRFSGYNLPYNCIKLAFETGLQEYNDFEEHESGYSESDLLITIGAGMICGALGNWYARKNDKSLHY